MVSHMHNVFRSFQQLNIFRFRLHCRNPKLAKMCYLVGQIALQRWDDNTKVIYIFIIWLLPKAFAETRWKNAEHREKTEAHSALVLNVQRISRFLIDCKMSQLFLRPKIFQVEHAEYCCGFNFKTISKLQAVITIEKLEMPSCRETCWRKSPNWPIRILRPPTAAQIF